VFLGISVIGWGILVVAFLPVALVLRRLALRSGASSSVFTKTAALTSLPFMAAIGEAAYVDHNWRALCETAKTEVKRKVVVEGFYDDGFFTTGWKILEGGKNGFRFVEWRDKEGRIWRTDGFAENELRTVQLDKPIARYHWIKPPLPVTAGHLLQRHDEKVVDTFTGEVIAHHVTFGRFPASVDRLWRRWFDDVPEVCGSKRLIWAETLVGVDRQDRVR
jgi:hypothetical protein